jgi:hypothetical protein
MANLKVEYCCRMRGTCQERKQKKLFLLFLLSHVFGGMHNGHPSHVYIHVQCICNIIFS